MQVSCNGSCIGRDSTTPGCTALTPYNTLAATLGSLALDHDYIYWVESRAGQDLVRAPKAGGPAELVTHRVYDLGELHINSTVAVWYEESDQARFFTVPKAGGEGTQVFAATRELLSQIPHTTLTDSRIYFNRNMGFAKGEVVGMDLDGGNLTVHGSADQQLIGTAASETMAYWIRPSQFGEPAALMQAPLAGTSAQQSKLVDLPETSSFGVRDGVRVVGDWVYLSSNDARFEQVLRRVATTGGTVEEVRSKQDGYAFPTETALYVVGKDSITETPNATGQTTTVFASPGNEIQDWAIDATSIYVLLNGKAPSAPTLLLKVR